VDGSRRLSQAISEGDGISLIGAVADAESARAAEEQGAEGLSIIGHVPGVREATSLPILYRADADPQAARDAGADACLLVVELNEDEGELEQLHAQATALGLEVVVDVHDEESLQAALERIDPEVFLLSPREAEDDEPHLERVLDLLPDVPAGKLAIADLHVATRDEVLALERAGFDGVIVGSADVAGLVGDAPPEV
jgi:indole-3-glycerol phosphate synthase